MAIESERPIEKTLREYSRKRREAARQAPELHPATRRLLQAEVKGHYGASNATTSAPKTYWSWLSWLRGARGWGVGGAVAALALVAILLIRDDAPSSRVEYFAKNEAPTSVPVASEPGFAPTMVASAPEAAPAASPPPQRPAELQPSLSTKASAGAEVRADSFGEAKDKEAVQQVALTAGRSAQEKGEVDRAASAKSAVTARRFAPAPTDGLAEQTNTVGAAYGLALAPVAPTAADKLAVSNDAKFTNALASAASYQVALNQPAVGQPLTQSFAVANLKQIESLSRQALLNNFSVEQSGNVLRVMDEDGSVYTGTVQTVATEVSSTDSRRERRVQTVEETRNQLQALQNVSFRVSGTNRSLKQNVVFTGNLLALDDAVGVANPSTQSVQAALPGANTPIQSQQFQQQLWFNNSRVTGKALVGGKVIQVDAMPVVQQAPQVNDR